MNPVPVSPSAVPSPTVSDGARRAKRSKTCSFLKKGTKKLLLFGIRASPISTAPGHQSQRAKVFYFLFFENKFFLPYFRAWFASGAEIAEKPPTARSMFGDHDF
jgi:hypothetical protein